MAGKSSFAIPPQFEQHRYGTIQRRHPLTTECPPKSPNVSPSMPPQPLPPTSPRPVPSAPPVPRLNLPSSDHQALVARSQSPTLQERTRLSKYTSKEDFIAKRARSPRHDNQPSGYYEAVREGNGLDPDNNYSIPGNNSHPEDTLWGYNP